jgi:hypothetical protein
MAAKPSYPEDYFYQKKYKDVERVERGEIPGVVYRESCLGCHSKGGVARELYWGG